MLNIQRDGCRTAYRIFVVLLEGVGNSVGSLACRSYEGESGKVDGSQWKCVVVSVGGGEDVPEMRLELVLISKWPMLKAGKRAGCNPEKVT